jgi:hypothetical protein
MVTLTGYAPMLCAAVPGIAALRHLNCPLTLIG